MINPRRFKLIAEQIKTCSVKS